MEGFLHEITCHVASSRNPYKNQAKWMLFWYEVRDCCVLRENLIKTKAKLIVFGAPGAFRGSKAAQKASQTLMIHKVSAKSLEKQMRKENELKGAYNSLSKSSFAKK